MSADRATTYRSMLGGLTSSLALPLPACSDDQAEPDRWSVELRPSIHPPPYTSDRPVIERHGEGVTIVFGGAAIVEVGVEARTVAVAPARGFPGRDVPGFVADRVVPLVASEFALVLHGGAVVDSDDGQAVLVVGASGAGKSTLVTGWCLEGAELLGDDTIRIDGGTAGCSFVGPRIWPGSLEVLGLTAPTEGDPGHYDGAGKLRLGAADGVVVATSPAPVKRIVLLGADPAGSAELTAVRLICEQALNLGRLDPAGLIDRVTELVGSAREIECRPAWRPPAAE